MAIDVMPPGSDKERDELSADTVLGGRVKLFQPAKGYRAAIDPVLLAATVAAQAGEAVIDLGCGVGTAGLCVLARLPGVSCTGIDFQQTLVDLAARNAQESGFGAVYRAVCANILDKALLATATTERADQVIVNPPYLPRGQASLSDHRTKALANAESDAALADWVKAAIAVAAPRGSITFIHRADRLPELLSLMQPHLGALTVLPIQPKRDEPARRVIVRGTRGTRAPARLLPALILHEVDGRFTPLAQAVLAEAAAIQI
jgi:tRNA1(Val) A37 N6-methylase TrmN6